MSAFADVLIVGSGPAGAQAAQTLVEAGLRVTMVDAGLTSPAAASAIPQRHFAELRREDEEQHRYFLGDDFGGVPLGRLGAAPQVTPPRAHVLQTCAAYRPVIAEGFAALESHALGGLGGAWGAVSFPFLDVELERAGLRPASLRPHYERVARRIGISGARDDLEACRGPLDAMQPSLPCDHNAAALLDRYARRPARWQRQRIYVGRPLLAALAAPLGERKAHELHDMDFWSNAGESVYRPESTMRRLAEKPNFEYVPGWLVERFAEERDGHVALQARPGGGGDRRTFRARRLILAAGALGTARIVLQSFRERARDVPLVCNAHLYVPCVHLRQLGRPHATRCHSLAQLTMIHDPTGDGGHLVQAQMYSYRSLLTFRLLKEAPLPARQAWWIMRQLAPAFAIWAIEEEDEPAAGKVCRLMAQADGGTSLEVVAPAQPDVETARRRHESTMMHGMRALGCWPIRRVHSGPGSSLHYGGQFPCSEREEPFRTDRAGRLHGTRSVYVVDGAAFAYLPAKGLTFTLMANADRVAGEIASDR